MKKTTAKAPEKRSRIKKYQYLLDMEPRDPETLEGEAIEFENTDKNYMLICSGTLPRYNRMYAPMKWAFFISKDKKSIFVQRVT